MDKNNVLFYFAREAGLEFVFTSGRALTYPLHTHVSVFTITVVRRGAVKLTARGSQIVYPAGSFYIVAPHEPHSPAYSDDFSIVSLCLKQTLFASARFAETVELLLSHGRRFMQEGLLSDEELHAMIRAVKSIYADVADAPAAGKAAPDSLLARSGSFASSYQFIRYFKRETGLTPHQYIIQNRVRKAKKALATPIPLSHVADMAGFYDQSHLNRWFNKTVGITPHAYKKACFPLEAE